MMHFWLVHVKAVQEVLYETASFLLVSHTKLAVFFWIFFLEPDKNILNGLAKGARLFLNMSDTRDLLRSLIVVGLYPSSPECLHHSQHS
jgi:hypothetical protein